MKSCSVSDGLAIFKALGSPVRVQILRLIQEKEGLNIKQTGMGSEQVLWPGLLTESCSLSRNHMYFPSSRFAVIISLHSLPLELLDSSQSKAMVCLKDTLWQLLPEVHFMHLADICTG